MDAYVADAFDKVKCEDNVLSIFVFRLFTVMIV